MELIQIFVSVKINPNAAGGCQRQVDDRYPSTTGSCEFVYCVHNILYTRQCPPGLGYNPSSGVCDDTVEITCWSVAKILYIFDSETRDYLCLLTIYVLSMIKLGMYNAKACLHST